MPSNNPPMVATTRGPNRSWSRPAGIIEIAKEASASEKAHWVVLRAQPNCGSSGVTKTLKA